MGAEGGVPPAPRGPGTHKAGARWFLRRPRQERRCAAAGPGRTRLPAPSSRRPSQSPRGRPPPGARGLSPAWWPQRRPSSSISQPGPQLRPPPRRMPSRRHHGHRRRLRASREPRRAGARRRSHGDAEGAAPSAGHSGSVPRLPPRPGRLAGLVVYPGRQLPPPRPPSPAPRGLRRAVLPLGKWGLPEAGKS